MKKLMKKLIAGIAAMTMVLGMALPAMAQTVNVNAGKGSLKVTNASQGQTYKLYKLFDASQSTDGTIAYTIPNNKTASDLGTYFRIVSGTEKNVEKTDALNQTTIATDGFKAWAVNFGTQVGTSITANSDGYVEWNNIPYGYYYIESSLGTAITVNSTTVTEVVDKNTKNPAEDTNKVITATKDSAATTDPTEQSGTDQAVTAKIGDTIYYKITFTATNYNAVNEAQTAYIVVDTSTGLNIDDNSVIVTITPQIGENSTTSTLAKTTDYTITKNGGTLTINIPWANTNADGAVTSFKYVSPVTVTITYKGVLTSVEGTNRVEVNKNGKSSTTKVETAEFDLTKVDSADTTKTLAGAEFELYDAAEGGNRIYVSDDGNGFYTVTAKANEVKIVSGTDGKFKIKGLKQGTTYYLQETIAPKGYTLPTARIAVEPNQTTDLTQVIINTGEVTNTKGTTLPSTGGIGTTIFYALGAALAIGAGVILVTRKRLSK